MNKKNTTQLSINTFNKQYLERGMRSQRSYPNESLIQFLATNYLSLQKNERANIKILELGCGTGANLWMLAKEGFDVYGVDSSEEALRLAEVHLTDKWGVNAKLVQGDFLDLPFPAEYFDLVVDVVSLQHLNLEASAMALHEAKRVLKVGGKFFSYRLSDHSVMYLNEKSFIDEVTLSNISNSDMPLANNGPVSFWSPGLLMQQLGIAKLEIMNIERIARTYSNGKFVEYLAASACKTN